MCLLLSVAGFASASENPIVADRVLRFVNNSVITQGEVWEKMRRDLGLLRRQGKPMPEGQAAIEAMRLDALDALTEEMLLNQEADRLQVQLDTTSLMREIRDWVRDNNLDPSVLQETKELKRRTKDMRANFVLRHYQSQWRPVTPQDVQQYYRENVDEFAKPQRAHGYRILIRSSGPREQVAFQRQLMELVQAVQLDPTPAVAQAISDDDLSRIVRTPDSERTPVLIEILQSVYDAIPDEANPRTQNLQVRLRTALRRSERMWDDEGLRAHFQSIKERVEAIEDWDQRLLRFTNFARKYSEGPNGSTGGDLGMQEIGSQEQAIEEYLFSMAPQTVSEPFKLGEFWCVVILAERDSSIVRSLRETAPEIRSYLENIRTRAIRGSLIEQLRRNGIVQDLDVEPELPPEWYDQNTSQTEQPDSPKWAEVEVNE